MKIKHISLWKLYFRQICLLFTFIITIICFSLFYYNIRKESIPELSFAISIFYALYIFIADYINGHINERLNNCFSSYFELYIEILDVMGTLNTFIEKKGNNETTLFLINSCNHRISEEKFGQLDYIAFCKNTEKLENHLLNFYNKKYDYAVRSAEDDADKYIREKTSSNINRKIGCDKQDILINPLKWLTQNYEYVFDDCFYNEYKKHMQNILNNNRELIIKKKMLSNTIYFFYKLFLFKLTIIKRKIYSVFDNKIDKEYGDSIFKNKIIKEIDNIMNAVDYCSETCEGIINMQVDKYELLDHLNEILEKIKALEEKIGDYDFANNM